MQYIVIIKAILALFPVVIEAIKAIEAAFPAPDQGKAKLEVVRATVESAYNVSSDKVATFEVLWGPLQTMIAAIVALANGSGPFKK